ncbi:MAG: endo-1,4-beta-xylanase, partial [Pseudothermotoga sp.]
QLKGKDGKPFIVAVYNLDPDPSKKGEPLEGPIPLMIWDKEEGWRRVTLKTLRRLAGLNNIGTEGSGWLFGDSEASRLVSEQVDSVTVSDFRWKDVEPIRGEFNFSSLDRQISKWASKGIQIRVQGVVDVGSWALPSWLKNGNYSREELEQIIRDHVTAVINYGKERGIREWVIIGEPYLLKYRQDDIFYRVFQNYDYIEVAYQAAREADPSAVLIYNDTDNHTPYGLTTSLTRKIVTRLRDKKLLDAVGIEGHIGDWVRVPNENDVVNTLRSYEVPVLITEFDYNLKGVTENRYLEQAKVYGLFFRAALKAGVKDFTFWGLDDRNSWLEKSLHQPDADPAMFDANLNPKPAYYVINQVLLELTSRN